MKAIFCLLVFVSFFLLSGADKERERNKLEGLETPDQKAQAVKKAFLHAWNGYINFAWGHDEVRPLSQKPHNWMNLGLTIVDSLDTIYIMGLNNSFDKAKEWVKDKLDYSRASGSLSLFETTIRIVGGLLSAYDLSGDYLFLKKAKEMADFMLPSFDSPTGLPYPSFSTRGLLQQGSGYLAEVGTLQMEFAYLSKHTGDPVYAQKALHVYDHCRKYCPEPKGLYPVHVGISSAYLNGPVTLGGTGDSYFEYLLKMYLLTNKKIPKFQKLYNESYEAIKASGMLRREAGFTFLPTYYGRNSIGNSMEHLACFAGGMFALGGDLQLGHEIAKTCYEMYHATLTGIGGESTGFGPNGFTPTQGARYYLLRPEAIETIFVMWRLTHNQIYREWGWKMFLAIEKHCKTENGYTGIRDVMAERVIGDDLQQSFFLAETLKYFYLLFSPDSLIPLDKYVFTTEAHPLSVFKDPEYIWEGIFASFTNTSI